MQCFKIHHPQLKNRYDKKKNLFDLEMGRNTNVYEVFHGTQNARKIVKQGFNPNLCHSKNRFGRGFYFAPESSKANSYAYGVNKGCPAHNDVACTRCTRQMLICKLAMGNTFNAKKIGAPPPGYNSIEAYPENVRRLHYPEIAVYHPDQVQHLLYIKLFDGMQSLLGEIKKTKDKKNISPYEISQQAIFFISPRAVHSSKYVKEFCI
jgi:Poly(ADP-ribose) polymerase catalytic domain